MTTPARSRHRHLIVALSAALLVAAAACGSDDADAGSADETTTSAPGSGDDRYGSTDGDQSGSGEAGTIVAEDFSLTDLTVAPGEEIVLRNDGSATHTATADDGAFDLGEVAGGATSDPATAPEEPGTYAFHCEIHASMTATLTVEG